MSGLTLTETGMEKDNKGMHFLVATGSDGSVWRRILTDGRYVWREQPKATRPLELIQLADEFLAKVIREHGNAYSKFPSSELSVIALMEEVGELAKAMLDESLSDVTKEAVQVAAMAMRVAIEGDVSVDAYRVRQGLEPTELISGGKEDE